MSAEVAWKLSGDAGKPLFRNSEARGESSRLNTISFEVEHFQFEPDS
jgi:hypothetical protein